MHWRQAAINNHTYRINMDKINLHCTPKALNKLKKMVTAKSQSNLGLRLSISNGGCAGMQYEMSLKPMQDGDIVASSCDNLIFVAQDSVQYLDECNIDYSDALSDSGFKITNPNAERSCGCGTSFEVKK